MEKCAATALSSKLVAAHKEFFSCMVVDAVQLLDDLLPLNMIGIKKVQGGSLQVSRQFDPGSLQRNVKYSLRLKIIYYTK